MNNLEGFRTREIKLLPDERGFFAEIARTDWKDFLEFDSIEQCNLSYSYRNVVRAWHKHLRGQVDYFCVLHGAVKICAYDDTSGKLAEVVANSRKLIVVRVPGKYWHGTKTLTETSLTLYWINKLYDYKNPDEQRKPWNDQTIIPIEINGKKDDPRVGLPYDWHHPTNK